MNRQIPNQENHQRNQDFQDGGGEVISGGQIDLIHHLGNEGNKENAHEYNSAKHQEGEEMSEHETLLEFHSP